MSESIQSVNTSGTYSTNVDTNNSPNSNIASLFSGKNLIILILLVVVVLSLIGINLILWTGNIIADISEIVGPAFQDFISMIAFTTGTIIKGSADVVANTTELGIDIAKGTTYSIGDLLISSNHPGLDESKQTSLSEVVGIPKFKFAKQTQPQPIQSCEPTVTPISTQKPKAGWCYVGDFSGLRGCAKVTEKDKCISGIVFASQASCLDPDKVEPVND